MRITFPALALLAAGVLLLSPVPARGQKSGAHGRPNIVFIISDDHRWDALGAAGNPKIKTLVLDRLAREGVYFRQATIHVSQCAPSRATLLTGLSPHQSGYYANNFLRADMQWADRFATPTVPGLLSEAGYRTVLVGKWHIGTDPWLTGFSDIRTWLPEGASSYTDSRLAKGNSRKREIRKGFTNGIFADEAVEFLTSAAAKERPFLLWLAHTIPHSPYQPNPSHIEHMYEGEATADLRPPGFPPDTPVRLGLEGSPEVGAEPGLLKYYESVSYLDELVGRVLAALEKQGLAENTVVVFLGDNGLMAGSRGVRGKVVPWEESVRVPLIPRLYDAYAGRYEFVTRVAVAISKEGDRLFFQSEFGGKAELIPKSETEFLHPRLPMRFTFVKDDGGRVTHVVRRNTLSPDVLTIDMKARKIE